jgi:lipopolysaccharide/colanic/teichoic acid biosynthesis glycosyltransferase
MRRGALSLGRVEGLLLNPTAVSLARQDSRERPRIETRRANATGAVLLGALSLLVSFLVMPAVYDLVAFHAASREILRPPVLQHVAFNCLANATVMLTAIGVRGRLDQKLTVVFQRVLLAHGALAFLTLISRHYYSIPMLLTGVAASALLGAAVMYVRHRAGRLRVGILGPWRPVLADSGAAWERIDDPDADVRRFDLIIVTFAGGLSPQWAQLLSRALLAGKRVRHAAEYLEEARGVVSIEHFTLDHLPQRGLTSYRLRKRLLDIVLVVATAPITLAVLGAASLAVLMAMGRPVFFAQPRVGQGGRIFTMTKLRTMRAASADEVGKATAKCDGRITPLGGWLRRFHIDELPQLWSVLIGEMSIVGPRPEQPGLAGDYARQIPAFAFRQMVRPGITGWAQVRAGYAADLAETQVKLGYDLFYLKNFSFALDLQIIARTFWTIIVGGGVR